MDQKRFDEVIQYQTEVCLYLLKSKGVEYNGDLPDRLKAFKTASALRGVNQAEALAGMMSKHTVSVYDMCHNPGHYSIEKWTEKITDHINYLLILKAIVMEEREICETSK